MKPTNLPCDKDSKLAQVSSGNIKNLPNEEIEQKVIKDKEGKMKKITENADEKEDKNEVDEIIIIYDFNKSSKIEIPLHEVAAIKKDNGETISKKKLFGERFVKNNKNICKIIINGKEKELCSYLKNYENFINEGKL